MSASALIREAANAGVRICLDGDKLSLTAQVKPPDALIAKIKASKPEIVELLRHGACAARPEPAVQVREDSALKPRIRCEPPFGLDHVPPRFQAAWEALLAQCPPAVPSIIWEAAIYDAPTLFGDFGKLIDEYRWTPGALFDVPGGLIWFIHGSPVVAIGRNMAQCQDGRIWRRTYIGPLEKL